MSYQQFRPTKFNLMPEAVKNLLIINGLFFLATYVLGNVYHISLEEKLGLYFFQSERFEPYQLITHLFMHGNIGHIFSNMFSLWMFGAALENYWGPKRFLVFYFATGLGAALIHSLTNWYDIHALQSAIEVFNQAPSVDALEYFTNKQVPQPYQTPFFELSNAWQLHPHETAKVIEATNNFMQQLVTLKMNIPTVGASGAVFGVLLAYGMLFPNTVLFLIFLPIPIKAKYFVIFYGLWELYNGFQNNPTDNVAHFAHLGGMLFGFILIKYWSRGRTNFY